ncbi:DUF2508 domain-containing protein [Cohnella algarum]|uniref:DUF2508 domain-containing protein n=1 Tax=Cohnella algarum TaxID=2044859 RepID=UPI0019676B0B|nr:DUF2508 domain-containing protein [Cohnella algarum]MBN2981458.1 DUF2508 domain-containing protein [Cohnella algarum]
MAGKKERKQSSAQLAEIAMLTNQIREAEREYAAANYRFDRADGADEVDYAIFAMEAAEKKMSMLLKKAKQLWNAYEKTAEDKRGVGP